MSILQIILKSFCNIDEFSPSSILRDQIGEQKFIELNNSLNTTCDEYLNGFTKYFIQNLKDGSPVKFEENFFFGFLGKDKIKLDEFFTDDLKSAFITEIIEGKETTMCDWGMKQITGSHEGIKEGLVKWINDSALENVDFSKYEKIFQTPYVDKIKDHKLYKAKKAEKFAHRLKEIYFYQCVPKQLNLLTPILGMPINFENEFISDLIKRFTCCLEFHKFEFRQLFMDKIPMIMSEYFNHNEINDLRSALSPNGPEESPFGGNSLTSDQILKIENVIKDLVPMRISRSMGFFFSSKIIIWKTLIYCYTECIKEAIPGFSYTFDDYCASKKSDADLEVIFDYQLYKNRSFLSIPFHQAIVNSFMTSLESEINNNDLDVFKNGFLASIIKYFRDKVKQNAEIRVDEYITSKFNEKVSYVKSVVKEQSNNKWQAEALKVRFEEEFLKSSKLFLEQNITTENIIQSLESRDLKSFEAKFCVLLYNFGDHDSFIDFFMSKAVEKFHEDTSLFINTYFQASNFSSVRKFLEDQLNDLYHPSKLKGIQFLDSICKIVKDEFSIDLNVLNEFNADIFDDMTMDTLVIDTIFRAKHKHTNEFKTTFHDVFFKLFIPSKRFALISKAKGIFKSKFLNNDKLILAFKKYDQQIIDEREN